MPRRLLLLNTDLEIGGTPTVVRELARRLRSPEVETYVACLAAMGPIGEQLVAAGVPVAALAAGSRFDLTVVPRLIRLIRREGIDVVLSFLIHANTVAALAHAWQRRGPTRWFQSIQTTQPTPRWHWHAQALAARSAEKIIVPSRSVAECAELWADIPGERIAIIPNGLDLDEFTPPRGASHVHAGLSRPLRVGFIGRLDPVKRIGDLIAAMTLLDPGFTLDIFGEGAERSRIEGQIAESQLGERVTLHGAVAQPAEALAAMDVLVLPSAAEGFGLVLIEAMAAGVPVVATDAPGIRDVVTIGVASQTGVLVPVGDRSALAKAILSVRQDSAGWQQRTANARREVEAKYTWSRVIPMYRDVLGLPE